MTGLFYKNKSLVQIVLQVLFLMKRLITFLKNL